MPETGIAKKLLIKPGSRLTIINAPEGYIDTLRQTLPADVQIETQLTDNEAILLVFAPNAAKLQELAPQALAHYTAGGVMWFAYPKAGQLNTDINRDKVWQLLEPLGIRPTTQIALDAVWSALRFRLPSEVGK